MNYPKFETCILCGSDKLQPVELYSDKFLCQCRNCSFTFVQRKPTKKELDDCYAKYSRRDNISPITVKRYNELLDEFEKYRQTNNLIDVGAGNGWFLAEAKKRGWNVYGTEFEDRAVEICREKGINMQAGALNVNNYEPGFFDAVTSFEVIEHIHNPNEELQAFNHILRKGGLLYITTPNFNGLSKSIAGKEWSIVHYPEHLSYYTPKTLGFALKRNGFNLLKVATTGISVSRLKKEDVPKAKPNVETVAAAPATSSDEQLRNMFEQNLLMKWAKSVTNHLLTVSGKGDHMKGWFEKN